jgi:hypothetical protein
MNWEAVAAIAEITASIGVLISLIYLGVQINGSNRAARSAATNNAATAVQSVYMSIGATEQASSVFFTGMTDPDSLSRKDLFQFVMLAHAFMLGFQNSFALAHQGTLNSELRDSFNKILGGAKDQPGFAVFWQQRGYSFQKEFREYVEEVLRSESVESSKLYDISDLNPQP